MPVKSSYRKKRYLKRKTYRRKARTTRRFPLSRTVARIPGPAGFPAAMQIKLKYCTTHAALTSSSADFDWNQYSLNSIYDPDVDIGGHQPFYRDQLAAIYGRYKVNGCKVKVIGTCTSTEAIMGYGTFNYGYTVPVAVQNAIEHGTFRVQAVSSQKPIYFQKYYNLSKLAGAGKAAYNDSDYGAAIGSDPTKTIRFVVGSASSDGGGTSGSASVYVELTYYVRFYELLTVASS